MLKLKFVNFEVRNRKIFTLIYYLENFFYTNFHVNPHSKDFQQDRLQKAEGEYNEELESLMDEFDCER